MLFKGIGRSEGLPVEQFRCGIDPVINQPQARIGGPAERRVVIVPDTGVQQQTIRDSPFLLPVDCPDRRRLVVI